MTAEQQHAYDTAMVPCHHCAAQVEYLAVFPAFINGTGSACFPCYIKHVDAKRTDQQRFAAMMGAFGGKGGAR